jgi:hypothetical protein
VLYPAYFCPSILHLRWNDFSASANEGSVAKCDIQSQWLYIMWKFSIH